MQPSLNARLTEKKTKSRYAAVRLKTPTQMIQMNNTKLQ